MSDEKTEAASAQRLKKAREEGDVPLSRDAVMLAALGLGAGALASQGAEHSVAWFAASLRHPPPPSPQALTRAAGDIVAAILAPAAAAALAAAAATLLQTGFLLRAQALAPDLLRISPGRGIKRILSTETLLNAGKSIAKLGVLAFVLWLTLRRLLPHVPAMLAWPASTLRAHLASEAVFLTLALVGAQAVFALADLFLTHFRYAHRLRMTRQEARDEHKQTEGNPLIRQRLRQLMRLRAKRRMMAAVPRATVVITNPTHYAVALAYQRGSAGAPRVVAKGADETAARIRELAREHRIPVVANPPLARALFSVEIDTEIPPQHFKAVAEIVAYIWRLQATRPRL
jgi:flagellar biosynthetic protein FlhB